MEDPRIVKYCMEICKAKCCTLHDAYEPEPVPCPRLNSNGSCSIYRERYERMGHEPVVAIGTFRSKRFKDISGQPAQRPFFCGRITEILAAGGLPPEVERQCCYAHPEVLEILGNSEKV